MPPLPTVLILEDDPVLQHLMVRVLGLEDYHVLAGNNGREGLALAKAYRSSLALVITDIDMPVMDGLAFARAFRLFCPLVPILFATGHADRCSSLQIANWDLLQKPFSPDAFVETPKRLLNSRQDDSSAAAQ